MSWWRVLLRVCGVAVAAASVGSLAWLGVSMLQGAPEVFPEVSSAPTARAEGAQDEVASVLTSEAGNFSVALFTRTGPGPVRQEHLDAAATDLALSLKRQGVEAEVAAEPVSGKPLATSLEVSVDGTCARTELIRHESGIFVAAQPVVRCAAA